MSRLFANKTWLALAFIGVFWTHVGFAMSIIPVSEEQLKTRIAEDQEPADGKPDGDVVLVSLFRSANDGARVDLTVMVDRFLTDRDSNVRDHLKPGDLFLVHNTILNPFLDTMQRPLFVAFLKRQNDQWLIMSMKVAPVEPVRDPAGNLTLAIRNPWTQTAASGGTTALGPGGQPVAQTPIAHGAPLSEKLGDFEARLRTR